MKAEDLINKHLILEGGSDLAITDGRIYNAFLNALNEAINYTHCCKSEQLLAYHKHLDSFNDPTIYNASESMIDDYLDNNCG